MAVRILIRTERRLVEGAFRTIGNTGGIVIRFCGSASALREGIIFGASVSNMVGVTISNTGLVGRLASRCSKSAGFEFRCSPRDFDNARPRGTIRVYSEIVRTLNSATRGGLVIGLPGAIRVYAPGACTSRVRCFTEGLGRHSTTVVDVRPRGSHKYNITTNRLTLLTNTREIRNALFNGKRHANGVSVIAVKLGVFARNISPGLSFSGLPGLHRVCRHYAGVGVSPHRPCVNRLMFATFSNSRRSTVGGNVGCVGRDKARC